MTPAKARFIRDVDAANAEGREAIAAMPPDLQLELFRHIAVQYRIACVTDDKTRQIELSMAIIGFSTLFSNLLEVEEANV